MTSGKNTLEPPGPTRTNLTGLTLREIRHLCIQANTTQNVTYCLRYLHMGS